MKFVYALLVLCCIGSAGNAQIVAISPTGDGGFELGGSFVANGWTAVNPALPNQWIVGGAAGPFGGTNCVYVTNTAGGAYAYTTTVSRTCHFYKDVTIPAGSVSIALSFQWKGFGLTGADQMLVYTAPTTVTPLPNNPSSPSTALAGATLVWTQPTTSGVFTAASIPLPVSLAGTTFRLIFTWQNGPAGGVSPGGAIDNISLTYNCSAPAAITGTASLCTGATTSLADGSPFGAWSSSNPAVGTISSSGIVTGITGGTTTISYHTTCVSPATLVVTVNAAPAPITGPTFVCLSTTATLGETSTGGTWSSTFPGVASVSATGVVTGNTLGTTVISYANGCGTPVSRAMTVNPLPTSIITTINHICAGGGTTTMSDATTGGTWSASPPANASATTTGPGTGLITGGLSGGTATVTYTSALGCNATTVITIDPLPLPITGAVPICAGNFTTVSDALPGGTWSSSVTGVATVGSSTGFVQGIVGGTTVISYINACGAATVVFTVNAYPGPIIGDDTICIGGTTALADPLIGGSWSSSNPAVAGILPSSGFATALAIGTTRITYTMPGGCSTTHIVDVQDVPPPITGVMHMCPTAITSLFNTLIGGTWSSGNPVVATVGSSSGVVTGIISDTAHIIYTTPAGCTVLATVTVDPVPAGIIGDTVLCVLQSSTLFDATPGGTWTSLTTAVATINATSGLISPVTTGTVMIKYTLPTGCSTTKSFNVKPVPVPVIGFNNITNMFYTDTSYATYQWYHSILGLITGATTYKTQGLHNGNYYVIVTDINGCTGTSTSVPYTLSMAVGSVNNIADVSISPNPANDMLYISSAGKIHAVISSMDGKKEMEQENAQQMDISRLSNGIHLITLYNQDGLKLIVTKLVKQ